MFNFLKIFFFCIAIVFSLSMKAFGGANNQVQKVEPDTNSSVGTELNKLKENSELSPAERARIRRALADYGRSSGKESHIIEEKQREMLKGLAARFIGCDEDDDNTLDLSETIKCLPQVARQFNRLDIDENEVISLDELAFLAKEFEKSRAPQHPIETNKHKNNQASTGSKTPI